jgi:hypothetical protein
MTFDQLHNDVECNCIEDAYQDHDGSYVRKINKDSLLEKDFVTHWERQIGHDAVNCNDKCSFKAVSINQFSDENLPQIIDHYTTTFNINPKKGCYYIRFKIPDGQGLVKPDPLENDLSHFGLYKSDIFSINSLEILETVKFA